MAGHERGIECKNIIFITNLTQQSYVAWWLPVRYSVRDNRFKTPWCSFAIFPNISGPILPQQFQGWPGMVQTFCSHQFSFLSPKNWQSSQFMVNPVGLGSSVWILKHWTIRDYRLKIGFKIPNLRGQKKKNSASAPSFELEKRMYICKEWMSVPTTNLGWDLTEYIEAIFGITCQQVERDNEKQ